MKKIAILGSTGSIGTQTLEIVRDNPDLQVMGLAAGSNAALMEKQIREFHPALAVMWSGEAAKELRSRTADLPVTVLSGMEGLLALASDPSYEILVTAIVGMIGIRPTIAAIESGKTIALANKETLVTAGHLIMPLAKKHGVPILPVDSEHSAIFQSMNGEDKKQVSKILLTASGGPFRGRSRQELAGMRAEDALKHPNWSMGRKITIDSASLVNKALEVMEARWLFDVDLDSIQVVIHPQSIIHSMVEYADGAVIAQLGMPDMKLPIQYALFYPERRPMAGERVDFYKLGQITFERPDTEVFTGLKLGMQAARTGGSMPTVFNAANEKAVALFLDHRIGFLEIPELIEKCMNHHQVIENPNVNEILQAEAETYEYIEHIKEN
ncbi:1-deoxy-D-xylulose-5-phosphate reductoisomerase [Eisenbergiella sp.]